MALESVNFLLAFATVVLQIITAVFLVLYSTRKKLPAFEHVHIFLAERGLWIGFFVALLASALTLFYSDVLGIAACSLCWWQRIFLYPQIFIFAIAAWKKDSAAALYSIALSTVGAAVALYQHFLQMGVVSAQPCSAIPETDCAARFLFEFGYITFPLMSFSLFVFLIVLMLFVRPRSA